MKRFAVVAAACLALGLSACGLEEPPQVSDKVAEYYSNPPTIAPDVPDGTLAVVGDSFSLDRPTYWMSSVARCLDYRLVVNSAGGTGFFNPGESSVPYGDPARMAPIVKAKPDLVIFETAYNDSWRAEWDQDTVAASVAKTVAAYRKALPKAKFVIVGPLWAQRPIPKRIENNKAALIEGAEQSKTPYINALDWLPSSEYVGNDRLHPNDQGHREISKRMIEALTTSKVVKGCA